MSRKMKISEPAHPSGVLNKQADAKVITVRMSPELHAALADEAHERRTSINQLAIAKLRLCGPQLTRMLQQAGIKLVRR